MHVRDRRQWGIVVVAPIVTHAKMRKMMLVVAKTVVGRKHLCGVMVVGYSICGEKSHWLNDGGGLVRRRCCRASAHRRRKTVGCAARVAAPAAGAAAVVDVHVLRRRRGLRRHVEWGVRWTERSVGQFEIGRRHATAIGAASNRQSSTFYSNSFWGGLGLGGGRSPSDGRHDGL